MIFIGDTNQAGSESEGTGLDHMETAGILEYTKRKARRWFSV